MLILVFNAISIGAFPKTNIGLLETLFIGLMNKSLPVGGLASCLDLISRNQFNAGILHRFFLLPVTAIVAVCQNSINIVSLLKLGLGKSYFARKKKLVFSTAAIPSVYGKVFIPRMQIQKFHFIFNQIP
ncbi:hypothetical protein [Nitrosomonas sp. ANs5]|uniref:hypothetical protein n=1 Tax=Nitrosomonas sp. ANs5 TaxID=3423941 RepID=UPI003D33D2E9